MNNSNSWFEVEQKNNYLFVIRERLDEIDDRFHTHYLNLYLLLGSQKALLIDTGCGVFPLKQIIYDIIYKKKLIVINTHSHWDHCLGNKEFNEIYIHENEISTISNKIDVSFLKSSTKQNVNQYKNEDFLISPAEKIHSLKNRDRINLGNFHIKIIHTPGHSSGSISLFTNEGELFTGDTAHYGSIYLPKREEFKIYLSSISKLIKVCNDESINKIYPSHETNPVGVQLLQELYNGVINIENLWEKKQYDKYLDSWIIKDNKFNYIIPR